MAESTDINLPRTHSPRFPDRCVVCRCHTPNFHVRLITSSIGWWTWLFWWWGKPSSQRLRLALAVHGSFTGCDLSV